MSAACGVDIKILAVIIFLFEALIFAIATTNLRSQQ